MATYSDWQQRRLDAESARALDRRSPLDSVVIVRYFGIDVAGAEYLQPDGTWKRHAFRTARVFATRAEGEAAAEQYRDPTGLRTISLWIAVP